MTKDYGKIETPEPRYIPELDWTVWEYDDHYMVTEGNVREQNEGATFPAYVKKTNKYGLDKAFETQITVDVPGLTDEDIQTKSTKDKKPEMPEESMY